MWSIMHTYAPSSLYLFLLSLLHTPGSHFPLIIPFYSKHPPSLPPSPLLCSPLALNNVTSGCIFLLILPISTLPPPIFLPFPFPFLFFSSTYRICSPPYCPLNPCSISCSQLPLLISPPSPWLFFPVSSLVALFLSNCGLLPISLAQT